jgi:hypothetical protein
MVKGEGLVMGMILRFVGYAFFHRIVAGHFRSGRTDDGPEDGLSVGGVVVGRERLAVDGYLDLAIGFFNRQFGGVYGRQQAQQQGG